MTDHRDAITGKFVTAEHADANPDTTVSESPCAECERLRGVVRGIRAYCEAFVEESEDPDPEPWNPAAYVLGILDVADVTPADGQPIVRTVGDLTARHIGKRVRVETDRTLPDRVRLLREIATASAEAVRLTLEVIDHPEWFLMASFDLDTPCEVLG